MYLSEPLVKERPVGGHSTEDLHRSCDILPTDTEIIIEPSHLVVKILEGAGSAGAGRSLHLYKFEASLGYTVR